MIASKEKVLVGANLQSKKRNEDCYLLVMELVLFDYEICFKMFRMVVTAANSMYQLNTGSHREVSSYKDIKTCLCKPTRKF